MHKPSPLGPTRRVGITRWMGLGRLLLVLFWVLSSALMPAATVAPISASQLHPEDTSMGGAPGPIGQSILGPAGIDSVDLVLTKVALPDPDGVRRVGDTVTFEITIRNDSTNGIIFLPLTDTYDPTALQFLNATPSPDSTTPLGTLTWDDLLYGNGLLDPLANGESITLTLNFRALKVGTTTNTATVEGALDEGSNTVPPKTASADVTITDETANPSIDIQKTPDLQQVQVGGTATFTIRVENTGNVTLAPVVVSDPLAPDCNRTFASMAPGAVQTYICTVLNVTADFTNVATATGTPPVGPNVTDTDDAVVDVIHPGIDIQKTPDLQQVRVGDTATFTIRVQNTGDVTLAPVVVSDPLVPDCNRTFASMAPGAVQTYTCTVLGVTADFTNIATATGTPPVGPNVTDTDDAVVDVIRPSIDIQKTPDLQQVRVGGTATFTIRVQNTGDVILVLVVVSDPLAPDCNRTFASMAPGAVQTYTCTVTNVTADFTNVATATGTPPTGPNVTDTDDAVVDVIRPSIDIQKTPDLQQVPTGSTATFTIRVENTGDVTLAPVVVSDPLAPDCNRTFASLAPGAVQTYTCTVSVVASFTNVATATGTPPAGPNVTDIDDAVVIMLTVDFGDAPDPTYPTLLASNGARHVIVPNIFMGALVDPELDGQPSPLANGDDLNPPTGLDDEDGVTFLTPLQPGVVATVQVVASVPGFLNAWLDFNADGDWADQGEWFAVDLPLVAGVNLVPIPVPPGAVSGPTYARFRFSTVDHNTGGYLYTGLAPDGEVEDYLVEITTNEPSIDIQKTPDLQQVRVGDTATFTIRVQNTGNVTLAPVVVSDPLAPNCGRTFASMAPGAVQTYDCTVLNVQVGFTNVATVTGTPPVGPNVTDSDDAVVVVGISPAIDLVKTVGPSIANQTPDGQVYYIRAPGGAVYYKFTVTNTGDTNLTNVSIFDNILGYICGPFLLPKGQSTTCYSFQVALAGDRTNIGTATGTPADANYNPYPGEPPVSDNDDAVVDVINPSIDIQKTPDLQQVRVGGTATFTIRVWNTGDVTLAPVVVSDPLAPDCNRTFASMTPGALQYYTCTVLNVTADFTNVATATGTPPVGPDVTDTDDAVVDVIHPSIDIQKTPDLQKITYGDTVTFIITVTNTGDVTLAPVVVSDPLAPDCNRTFASLAPGAVQTYTCTVLNVTRDFTNVATATGTPPVGPNVTDIDDAVVDVARTGVDLVGFEAEQTGIEIVVRWQTWSEQKLDGFVVWRADQINGDFVVVSDLIPASNPEGASYEWRDVTAKPGRTYWYKLEARPDGEMFGPVSAKGKARIFIPLIMSR